MPPHLGLVCITASKDVRYRTVTRKRLLEHSESDRQHADLIDTMPSSYLQAPWIEVEAKLKEEAIRKLQAWTAGAVTATH
jgi:UV DNA damage repair endonuclease